LREPLQGRKRADVIVVTKTPSQLTDDERKKILARIDPYPHQQVYFSYLDYGDLVALQQPENKISINTITTQTQLVLLTGIANPAPLVTELKRYSSHLVHHQYPDHYQFAKKNISKLVTNFKILPNSDKLVITTEKDAQRLKASAFKELLRGVPVYYIPIKAAIHQPDEDRFNDLIKEYVRKHPVNHRIYKA
jgi:tetraacyldisaccharide 4'-kinase